MSQVSKRNLGKEIEKAVFESFWRVVAKLSNKDNVSTFFSDFFSPTEKIIFAKRLYIALLIDKGYDYRQIRDLLKVSTATIGKIVLKINDPGWKLFIKKVHQIEDWDKTMHDLETMLWRFSGSGRRAFKSKEELEGIIKKSKRISDLNR